MNIKNPRQVGDNFIVRNYQDIFEVASFCAGHLGEIKLIFPEDMAYENAKEIADKKSLSLYVKAVYESNSHYFPLKSCKLLEFSDLPNDLQSFAQYILQHYAIAYFGTSDARYVNEDSANVAPWDVVQDFLVNAPG